MEQLLKTVTRVGKMKKKNIHEKKLVLNTKKNMFFRFFILEYLFYKCLLALVKKTKFGNNLPKLMLVELPEPSATCVRGMSCQPERHFSTMSMSYRMLRYQSTKIIIFIQATFLRKYNISPSLNVTRDSSNTSLENPLDD